MLNKAGYTRAPLMAVNLFLCAPSRRAVAGLVLVGLAIKASVFLAEASVFFIWPLRGAVAAALQRVLARAWAHRVSLVALLAHGWRRHCGIDRGYGLLEH